MIQSTFYSAEFDPFHVAIVMDGNGRWATNQGLPRAAGHTEGSKAVRRTVEKAVELDVTTLTLYAFSSDNWKRPEYEVDTLMNLFQDYLQNERERCLSNGIKLSVIGRRDRLSFPLQTAIKTAESDTFHGEKMHLRIAIDYSARDSILFAASRLDSKNCSREMFSYLLNEVNHSGQPDSDVDLLIRTGGEKRLSDFLLWESAYAELCFIDKMWPDFSGDDLEIAINEYKRRERRFGALPAGFLLALLWGFWFIT